MNNPYGNDILTLMDENGVEYTFEVLDEYDDSEKRYLALSPVFDDPQDMLADTGDLVIMQVCEEDGEELLEPVDDEDELAAIAEIFMKRLEEDFDFEEDEE